MLCDQEIAGLREARRKIDEALGQDFGKGRRFVDATRPFLRARRDIDEHDGRVRDAKPLGQRLAAFDERLGADGLELAAEDAALQVDEDESGRLRIEVDHGGGSKGRGMRLVSVYYMRSFAEVEERAPKLSPVELADLLVDHKRALRSDRDGAIALSGAIAGIMERRGAMRRAA